LTQFTFLGELRPEFASAGFFIIGSNGFIVGFIVVFMKSLDQVEI
jgi:hypothetical protein